MDLAFVNYDTPAAPPPQKPGTVPYFGEDGEWVTRRQIKKPAALLSLLALRIPDERFPPFIPFSTSEYLNHRTADSEIVHDV